MTPRNGAFIKFVQALLLAVIIGGGAFVGNEVFSTSRDVAKIKESLVGLDRYFSRDIERLENRVERLEQNWEGPM